MTPRISVVLAVHNGERHLMDAVGSILRQSLRDFELIIIDDGSTDRTSLLLAALSAEDPRLVVVRQENQGLTRSLNVGISLARGTLIARHDADDVSVPDRFVRQVAFLDAHPSVAAVGSSADVIDRAGARTGTLAAAVGAETVRAGLLSLRTTPVHGSMMMRREMVCAVGGYREAFPVCQDYDLWLRLSSRFDMDNLPEVLYQWRLDQGSVYTERRATQLRYAAIARVFADERARWGTDASADLRASEGQFESFVAQYRLRARVYALWAELLLRGLGNSSDVRRYFRRALRDGHVNPWVISLCIWTHLGLPWPGGRPLTVPSYDKL